MATTTTYTFNKPTVGGDLNTWGGDLNDNWDSVDDLLDGTTAVSGIDINGGSIDGTPIGAATASTGAFTSLNATGTATLATVDINGGAIDGTSIGASAASTGAFTTLSSSGLSTLADAEIISAAPIITFDESDTSSEARVLLTGGSFRLEAKDADGNNTGDLYIGGWGPASAETIELDGAAVTVTGDLTVEGSMGPTTIADSTTPLAVRQLSTGTLVTFRNSSNTEIGSIVTAGGGSSVVYNTSSARALKDKIVDYELDSGAMLDALKPRSFDWRAIGERAHGFIADEFAGVFPDSTSVDESGYAYAIDAGTPEVVALLVAELKALRKRVAELEAK